MFDFVFGPFKKGFEKLRDNPQLIYTALVALLIVAAFLFMAERFIGIASSAQERLVNVRAGSIQDAFASFAGDRIYDTDYLNEKIQETITVNETIRSFQVVVKSSVLTTASTTVLGERIVVASNDKEELGQIDRGNDFLFSLAASDPVHSITIEETKNGERLFNTARAITDASGEVIGAVITVQTLSEADRAIQNDINSSLGLLIVVLFILMLLFLRFSRVIDYMSLYRKLKEVDQLKNDFISMASHELRTPLSIIRGYAEYIGEAPELSPTTKEYASKISISVQGLDSLVADILDVSRIDQGRMSFALEPVHPELLIADVVAELSGQAKEKGISLAFDTTGVTTSQVISADKSRFKQVLVNIIGNAVKYTAKGEVKVRQYEEQGRVVIRVSDTGFGMSEEERTHLFEKFYRIRTKDTENIRGTGLGLWITKQIIEAMKGTVSVESIKGVGSHFIISFPTSGQPVS